MIARPLHDNVVIKEIPAENKIGSLYIPDTAQPRGQFGTVMAVGMTEDGDMPIGPGDRVIFGRYSGSEVELDGEKYLIMRVKEILATLEDE